MNESANSSSRSASRDSLLGHHDPTLLSMNSPSQTSCISGETIDAQPDVERSHDKAASEMPKSHGDTMPSLNSWRDNVVILVFYCWSSCLLTYLAFALLSPTSLYSQTRTACLPDGNFDVYFDSYSPWATEGTFQITMAYGAISFGQAKAIDVVWDVVSRLLSAILLWTRHILLTILALQVVGRFGQMVLGTLSYQTFSAYLTVSLIDHPLKLATFRAIFLKDNSWTSFFGLLTDLTSRWCFKLGRKHVKEGLVMVFLVFSILFVMIFPTLAGAMTGYTATYAAFIKDFDDNFARFETFTPIVYNISDDRYIDFTTTPVVPYYSLHGGKT